MRELREAILGLFQPGSGSRTLSVQTSLMSEMCMERARRKDTLREFFRADDIGLREFGLPDLDELLADELFELDDEARSVFWRNTLIRLEDSANQGHAFAQKLLILKFIKTIENRFIAAQRR